jgi:hypothetical protein
VVHTLIFYLTRVGIGIQDRSETHGESMGVIESERTPGSIQSPNCIEIFCAIIMTGLFLSPQGFLTNLKGRGGVALSGFGIVLT